MPYFKDTQNDLHFLEQSDIDDGWLGKISGADVWVPITDSDAQAILNPPKTAAELTAEANAAIIAQIDALEQAQLMPRITREFFLTQAEQMGAAMSPAMTPTDLYTAGSSTTAPQAFQTYKKLKDFDNEIAALRAQLK